MEIRCENSGEKKPEASSAKTHAAKTGYGDYQEELKGGNLGNTADSAAEGDMGIAVGGGLDSGKNNAGVQDADAEEEKK